MPRLSVQRLRREGNRLLGPSNVDSGSGNGWCWCWAWALCSSSSIGDVLGPNSQRRVSGEQVCCIIGWLLDKPLALALGVCAFSCRVGFGGVGCWISECGLLACGYPVYYVTWMFCSFRISCVYPISFHLVVYFFSLNEVCILMYGWVAFISEYFAKFVNTSKIAGQFLHLIFFGGGGRNYLLVRVVPIVVRDLSSETK